MSNLFDNLKLTEVFDVGEVVCCDSCNEDSHEVGGGGFSSSAYCPKCFPRIEASAKKYHEEKYLKYPKEGQTFHDFVIEWRDGNNTIKIYS